MEKQEHEFLVCTARPTNEKRGLYGRRLLHNVPVGDPELIDVPVSQERDFDGYPAVDIMIHDYNYDIPGFDYCRPQSDHYQLDLIPVVQAWSDKSRDWIGPNAADENILNRLYHPLTKVHIRSWARFAFSYSSPWHIALQNAGYFSLHLDLDDIFHI